MRCKEFDAAAEMLQNQPPAQEQPSRTVTINGEAETLYLWPGAPNEEVLLYVGCLGSAQEPFHRDDYFSFVFPVRGECEAVSQKFGESIGLNRGELYVGKPSAGHALRAQEGEDAAVICLLVRKDAFFRSFLPLADTPALLRFFLDPEAGTVEEEYLHFSLRRSGDLRALVELMASEYVRRLPDTQQVLKPLAQSFFMFFGRLYAAKYPSAVPAKLSDCLLQYMAAHPDNVTLTTLAQQFAYHPNYISTLLRRETGRSFSELLLDLRMERAASLLRGTTLPISEVSLLSGYANSSNFYKAFREYYHETPREYLVRMRPQELV